MAFLNSHSAWRCFPGLSKLVGYGKGNAHYAEICCEIIQTETLFLSQIYIERFCRCYIVSFPHFSIRSPALPCCPILQHYASPHSSNGGRNIFVCKKGVPHHLGSKPLSHLKPIDVMSLNFEIKEARWVCEEKSEKASTQAQMEDRCRIRGSECIDGIT